LKFSSATEVSGQRDYNGGVRESIFEVQDPNPYAAEFSAQQKMINVRILPVHFRGRWCSLLYMQDMSSTVQNNERERNARNILTA